VTKIVSVTSAKVFMNIPASETEWDTFIDDYLIPGVSGRIERYLNRELVDAETNVAEYFDSDGFRTVLPLRRYPINTGATVTIYESPSRTFVAGDALGSTEFVTWPEQGILELVDGRRFISGVRHIKVTYQGGYTEDESGILESVPDDIVQACYMQIGHVWQRRTSMGSTTQAVAGGAVLTFQGELDLLKDVKAALRPWRRVPL
jgi:hypothetical protein